MAFLKKVLGSKAVAKPKFDFKDTVTNATKFAATAQVLEDTGVHAYLGQVAEHQDEAGPAAAGAILSVEARHAAWIRDIRYRRHDAADDAGSGRVRGPLSPRRRSSLPSPRPGFIVG